MYARLAPVATQCPPHRRKKKAQHADKDTIGSATAAQLREREQQVAALQRSLQAAHERHDQETDALSQQLADVSKREQARTNQLQMEVDSLAAAKAALEGAQATATIELRRLAGDLHRVQDDLDVACRRTVRAVPACLRSAARVADPDMGMCTLANTHIRKQDTLQTEQTVLGDRATRAEAAASESQRALEMVRRVTPRRGGAGRNPPPPSLLLRLPTPAESALWGGGSELQVRRDLAERTAAVSSLRARAEGAEARAQVLERELHESRAATPAVKAPDGAGTLVALEEKTKALTAAQASRDALAYELEGVRHNLQQVNAALQQLRTERSGTWPSSVAAHPPRASHNRELGTHVYRLGGGASAELLASIEPLRADVERERTRLREMTERSTRLEQEVRRKGNVIAIAPKRAADAFWPTCRPSPLCASTASGPTAARGQELRRGIAARPRRGLGDRPRAVRRG